MGQSLLIDMNSGWYKHKTEVNDGLIKHDYNQVMGALDALNALLPNDYRVIIDTEEYRLKTKGDLVGLCNFCLTELPDPDDKDKTIEGPTQIRYEDIKTMRLLLNKNDQFITGKQYEDFWQCHKCNNLNMNSKTRFRQTILRKPYYLQVVPEPPRKKLGVEGRYNYHEEFAKWARNFMAELNAQAQKFRQEYKPKDGDDGEQFDDEAIRDDELFD